MDVSTRVKEIIKVICEKETITLIEELQRDLAFDSLMMVMLLLQIEEEFGIELEQGDMNPMTLITVLDVVDLVKRYEVK